MLSKTVSSEALALILDGESYTNDEINRELETAFVGADIPHWQSFEADIYTYNGRTLVLAYPAPPTRERVSDFAARLVRA